jgi:ribosome-associated translation inhibitor RaiA
MAADATAWVPARVRADLFDQRQDLIDLSIGLEQKRLARRRRNLMRLEALVAPERTEVELEVPSREDTVRETRIEGELDLLEVALRATDSAEEMRQAIEEARDEIRVQLYESQVPHYHDGMRHRAHILTRWLDRFDRRAGRTGAAPTRRTRNRAQRPPPRLAPLMCVLAGAPPREAEFFPAAQEVARENVRFGNFCRTVHHVWAKHHWLVIDLEHGWARYDGIYWVFQSRMNLWHDVYKLSQDGYGYRLLLNFIAQLKPEHPNLANMPNRKEANEIWLEVRDELERFIRAYEAGESTDKLIRSIKRVPREPKLGRRSRRSSLDRYLEAARMRRGEKASKRT